MLHKYVFEHLNDFSSSQKDYFEEEVVEERKSPTASQEELPSSTPTQWRKPPPEGLHQSQESLLVPPLGEMNCDFVLEHVNESWSDS